MSQLEDQIREKVKVVHIEDAGSIVLKDHLLRVAGQEVKPADLISSSGLVLTAAMEQAYYAGFAAGTAIATKAVSEAFEAALAKQGAKVTVRG